MKNLAVEKAIKIVGNQTILANALGCRQSLVSAWLHGKKRVSVSSVPDIVDLTKGEVQPHELRPDLPKVFPPPGNY
ncbi:helix-turn-helix domain-containing protein [Photorhabdus temperata]|uniref:Transcriptional regulator n=1 Tax=Photorhabdus akhurstii TaxID=171438 RepID=A0ABX8LRX9_9GAMM|nr:MULTISPECIES: helix-turn-helix domain-containing protein [Photorhabdus]KGM29094.1 transcriptional regulator [Photorhabdus luminescens]MBS9426785.1 helix-turn-helix domain-containing protein [Photorhabdus akhurstii]MBS9431148.1 helix-turn-helix domain-containing protein [Photorhabdus hainanensis]MCC8456215.1 helix-turn-helix domain-containing protein [Photorhabdus aegyptia]MCT8350158.1 helix-turn-helix domain-containing protein [Photorhabdus temperata]